MDMDRIGPGFDRGASNSYRLTDTSPRRTRLHGYSEMELEASRQLLFYKDKTRLRHRYLGDVVSWASFLKVW